MIENKIIVAGGRDFNNRDLLYEKLDYFLQNLINIEIVSGCAAGADSMAIEYAANNELDLKRFPADWNLYGKKAGYIRNRQMARYATHCVCFWDGKSPGTKIMISLAKEFELKTRIVHY